MSLDVLLLSCFLVSVVALWLLNRIDRRHKRSMYLYGEALKNLQMIDRQKLEELKMIRLYEGQQLMEIRKISARIPDVKESGYKHTGPS